MSEYQPLRDNEDAGKHLLANNDFGLYTYDLVVRSSPAGQEITYFFETNLGISQVVNVKFQNYVQQKSDYICTVSFYCGQCVNFFVIAKAIP